jgi:hypothetical protein
MGTKHRVDSLAAMRANNPTPQQVKLRENSDLCRVILETEFKSEVKGDGLQRYRMNEDDQKNILGYNTMILFGLAQDPTGDSLPLFYWQNADQPKCEQDWHYSQIIGLFKEYGAWKTAVLKRQDEIKYAIMNANTDKKLNNIKIDYSDLLVFGGVADDK